MRNWPGDRRKIRPTDRDPAAAASMRSLHASASDHSGCAADNRDGWQNIRRNSGVFGSATPTVTTSRNLGACRAERPTAAAICCSITTRKSTRSTPLAAVKPYNSYGCSRRASLIGSSVPPVLHVEDISVNEASSTERTAECASRQHQDVDAIELD